MKKETIKQYPIVRYLCLLLVVALLFAGVTFSRYQSRFTSENSVGVAEFDASYTIDSVNTTSFGNTHFWQLYNGFWMDQGSGTASTVRITMYNNSAIDLRPTIRMEGPAEFWENIALQITPTTGTGSNIAADTENPLTTQLVIADLVKERTEATQDNEHVFEYDKYRQWSEGETFNTSTSDNFGQLGSGESTLAMTGGITVSKTDGTVSGSVTATRQSKTVGKVPETRPENNWNMTITASMKNVDFSLGFTRQQGSSALPALYLDCTANVPYYTIEIDIPMELKAKSGDDPASATYVMYLNWTNAIQAKALGIEFPTGAGEAAEPGIDADFWNNLIENAQPTTITANGTEFTVLGYHFNYTDVPYSTSAGGANAGDTTVRLTRNFANTALGTTETISYQHIARLNENDAVFPHDIAPENGYYRCSGDNPAYFATDTIRNLNTDFLPETLKTMQGGSGNDNTYDYVGVSEKGYTTRISVNFVQTSVLPATGTTSTTF